MNSRDRRENRSWRVRKCRGLGLLFVGVAFATAAAATAKAREPAPVLLGPAETGTWSGSSKWPNGAYGAAATFYDFNDSSGGVCSFALSNSVAGKENRADWRCLPFSLGPASGGAQPVTFSFAYKFSDPVIGGNNMRVLLRFFDKSGTGYVGGRMIQVGAHTADSAMANYRTLTINDIMPPKSARMADITVIANIDEPWISGTGRFDDFALTTQPGSPVFKFLVATGVVASVGVGIGLFLKRRKSPAGVAAPGHR